MLRRRLVMGLSVILTGVLCLEARSEVGEASYYAPGLKSRTADGGHVEDFTAAHRSLPFGTKVRVTNLANKRSVIVAINDRGPFGAGRVIDVSAHAAEVLGFRVAGVARVSLQTLPR